jgi:branched-chain amino acid transport system permease protein
MTSIAMSASPGAWERAQSLFTGLRGRFTGKSGMAPGLLLLLLAGLLARDSGAAALTVLVGVLLVGAVAAWVCTGAGRVVALGAMVLASTHLALHKNPPTRGVLLLGATIGLIYAMLAFGLIIIFRTSRVINFAQSQMGVAPALLAVLMLKIWHVPYLLAFVIAVVAGAALGAVVNLVVIQRFFAAPRLLVSVATIGVSLLVALLQFYLPVWFGKDVIVDPTPPVTPLTRFAFSVDVVDFNGNFLAILFFAVAVVVGLAAFFTRSDTGLAIRGAAENADRATLLGISTRRLSLVAWTLAGALAALAVFLRVPVIGVPVGADIGPSVLLYGLAAAVAARMESFPLALGAGIAIGVVDQSVYFSTRDPSISQAILLPVLLGVMLAQRAKVSRGEDSGLASWRSAAEYRPLPPELRGVPLVQWAQVGVYALVGTVLVVLPFVVRVDKQALMSIVVIFAILAVSLVILTGWAGQISLGQWGLAAIGAFTAGWLGARHNADFFVVLLLAGAAGAVAAIVIGLPALRIQGLYLAVTTLAFGLAAQVYLLSPNYFGDYLPDTAHPLERPRLYGYVDISDPKHYYFVCLGALLLALASARSLRNSRTGRAIVAGRDNVRGTQAFGISTSRAKLAAFAISGFWAALGGALLAYQQQIVEPGTFSPSVSFQLLIIVVIGGVTSLPGALAATAYIGLLQYGGFSAQYQALASGVGVLLLLYFLPGGLAQLMYGKRDDFLRWVAAREGIHVPSLLADSLQATVSGSLEHLSEQPDHVSAQPVGSPS